MTHCCAKCTGFLLQLLWLFIGLPLRIVETLVVSHLIQFITLTLSRDWLSVVAGFSYGYFVSYLVLLPLAHWLVFQSPLLCTVYVSSLVWCSGHLAHAFALEIAGPVAEIQESCLHKAQFMRIAIKSLTPGGYLGLMLGLLYAFPIATPIRPGLDPFEDRLECCTPLLRAPMWLLVLVVFTAALVTARIRVPVVEVPRAIEIASSVTVDEEDSHSATELLPLPGKGADFKRSTSRKSRPSKSKRSLVTDFTEEDDDGGGSGDPIDLDLTDGDDGGGDRDQVTR